MKYAIMMQEVVDVAGIFSWEVTMVKLIKGESDLATLHPDLVKEWHPIKNGDLMPEDISSGSGKEVWWLCPEGHTYSMVVNQRTKRGYSSNDLYGVLTIKDIVDTITAAHLYRVDLVQVEILDGFFNLSLRQWPLVFLIRYEIFDRDLLEVDIRNKSAEVLH